MMLNKEDLKVGTKVWLKEELTEVEGEIYTPEAVIPYLGKVVTIKQVNPDIYMVEEIEGCCFYFDDFECLCIDVEDSEPESDLCMESEKVDVSNIVSNNIMNFEQIQKKQHNTHYLKFTLNKPNLSIRYHLSFEDNKDLEKKWILKDHNKKVLEVITSKVARMLIENFCEVECQEIIGRLEFGKYQKIIVNSSGVLKEFE